ncbi:hypothetical protein, partial [Serratia marcescens]|uniref:hypothetical protein n=1 Tax=Serratia marcescens TaxID=615 RepID=UPI0019808923
VSSYPSPPAAAAPFSSFAHNDMKAALGVGPDPVTPLICRWDNRLYPPRPGPYNGPFLGYGAAENGGSYGFGSLLLKDTLHEKVVTSARSRDDGAEFLLCKRL